MFILRRENNPDRQGKKSTIGGKRSLVLVYKEDVRGIDWAGVFFFFLSLTFLKSKHKNNKSPPRQITKGTGENESIRKGSTFSFFLLSYSGFLCLPTSRFPRDCSGPVSRGTAVTENQSPRQTTREHKGVNDKQMKGRISDTCSLPLFLYLRPSRSPSPQPVFPF